NGSESCKPYCRARNAAARQSCEISPNLLLNSQILSLTFETIWAHTHSHTESQTHTHTHTDTHTHLTLLSHAPSRHAGCCQVDRCEAVEPSLRTPLSPPPPPHARTPPHSCQQS